MKMVFTTKYFALILATVAATAALGARGVGEPFEDMKPSDQCKNTLFKVATNPYVSGCLNSPGISEILLQYWQPDSSFIPAINAWGEGVCRADACSDDTIKYIVKEIFSGCKDDLEALGIEVHEDAIERTTIDIIEYYPLVRKVYCLKTASTGIRCTTSTLTAIEDYIHKPLTLKAAMAAVKYIAAQGKIPSSLTCTECSQGAFSIFRETKPDLIANPIVSDAVGKQCGIDFLTASTPPDIVDGTENGPEQGDGKEPGPVNY